jgi:hypothetical protein
MTHSKIYWGCYAEKQVFSTLVKVYCWMKKYQLTPQQLLPRECLRQSKKGHNDMKVIEIELKNHLTTTYFDPSPHRFHPDDAPVSERKTPLVYNCENCGLDILFKTSDFEKHISSVITNLEEEDNIDFHNFEKFANIDNLSFLDFYCPGCNQATKFLFKGGPSGYWGEFFFQIDKIIVKKNTNFEKSV